jgi:hypothetical protein
MTPLLSYMSDPTSREFREEARRQGLLLRTAPEQEEATAFIEANGDFSDWTSLE